MNWFTPEHEDRLRAFARRLVDPRTARVAIEPMRPGEGHWFGGGNVVEAADGTLYLTGRYRNHGDSRTGLGAGERGLELAIWASVDGGARWDKRLAFDKARLALPGHEVISIEGSALALGPSGVELFVSTEKAGIGYREGLQDHLKPGAGVWSIDRLAAPGVEALAEASPTALLACADPQYVHVKDPHVYGTRDGAMALVFCTHPFSWASSNSGYALRRSVGGAFEPAVYDFFPRGAAWDVAITRATALVDVPRSGAFADVDATLVFYDGGESLRDLDQHASAVSRPRGYSCEELGGIGWFEGTDLHGIRRISRERPEFVSDEGTGCHRYVDVARVSGGYLATWQRSRSDRAQPLMMNIVGDDEVADLLA